MKATLLLVSLLLWPIAWASAADLIVSGSWTRSITGSDLTAGAGSALHHRYESDVDGLTLTILNTRGAAWHVRARVMGGWWANNLKLSIKRTSDGHGTGPIAGATTYIPLSGLDVELFSGSSDRRDIRLQIQLDGVSTGLSPNTYGATIIYTVTP